MGIDGDRWGYCRYPMATVGKMMTIHKITVAYLQASPGFNCKTYICGNCISGPQRVRSFEGYEAIFVLSIWSHLVSWPILAAVFAVKRRH